MTAESTSKAAQTDAGAGTETRRTAANAERDSVFDRNNQDIDTDSAYSLAGLNDTRAWNANVKRTYDTLEEQLSAQFKESQTHITNVNAVRLRMLADLTTNADNLQKQHLAHRDIATDRTWTQINELETMLAAKSGVQADAFVAALMKALSDLNAE